MVELPQLVEDLLEMLEIEVVLLFQMTLVKLAELMLQFLDKDDVGIRGQFGF